MITVLLTPTALRAQGILARADSAGADAAARSFLIALDSLQWERFEAAWAPAATVFLPDADNPHLLPDREAVLAYFRVLFAEVQAEAGNTPPTLHILPSVRNMRTTLLAPTVALVTFELGRDTPGRRTLIWVWDPKSHQWHLHHLHASLLTH